MNYEQLATYKLLIEFGCSDGSGPIMRKKGIVKFHVPVTGTMNQPYYHFDPHYEMGGKFYSKAARKQGSSSNEFFIKQFEEDDYELAFLVFFLHFIGIRNLKEIDKNYSQIIKRNKLKILKKIFEEGK